jgi:xanthine dehydrogenase accessory factor
MLCSPTKLKDYLDKTYQAFGPQTDLSHFYSPIGLDTGGGSPEEIAISIAAEILSIHHDKKGHKHLRETLNDQDHYWKHS